MAYPLRTDRLLLEPLRRSDLPAFVAYRRDPDVARWQSWSTSYSQDNAERLVAAQPSTSLPMAGNWLQLAVRRVDIAGLIGDVAVHRATDQPDTYEIGVTFSSSGQGHGYATEAVARVLHVLFTEGGAHRVTAFCDARNEPVARLLRRLHLRQESHQIAGDFYKGEWTTLDGYAILSREFGRHDDLAPK